MVIFYVVDARSLKYCERLEIALKDYRQLQSEWSHDYYHGERVPTFTVHANANLVAQYVGEVNKEMADS